MDPSSAIPLAPHAIPVLGHIPVLLHDPLRFLTSLPTYGDLVRVRFGPMKLIVVCDPDLTQKVLRDDHTFDKGGAIIERAREVLGDGLGTCPYSRHRRLRRLAQPAFQPQRFPGYAQVMTACFTEMIDSWHNGQVVAVMPEMTTIAARTLTTTMFSAASVTPQSKDVEIFFEGVFRRTMTPPRLDWIPTRHNRCYREATDRLRRTINEIITDRRANGTGDGDLLSALLTANDPESDDQWLSDEELTDNLLTFYAAGSENTAATLSWALYLLASHPGVRQRLHEEIDTVLAGRPATYDDLPDLELTHRVILETLRLWGPSWMLTRTVATNTELGGFSLPAGTNLIYSSYLVHHRSDLYADPYKFDPDRWDSAHAQPPRHAVIPFGGGARKCIGDTFGMMEATLGLASIAARWRLDEIPGERPHPSFGLGMKPSSFHMRAVSRNV